MTKHSYSLAKLWGWVIIIIGLSIRLIRINQPLLEFFPQRQTQTAEITRNIYVNGWDDFWIPKVRYFTLQQDSHPQEPVAGATGGQAGPAHRADSGSLTGEPIPYVLEFPLYNALVAVAYKIFGPNVIFGRLMSLTFFVLSSIVFYRLLFRTIPTFWSLKRQNIVGAPEPRSRDTLEREAESLRRKRAYCWGAFFFFVFSPLHILISRSFQPEELALFLLLLAVYKKSWLIFSIGVLTKLPISLFFPVMVFATGLKKSSLVKLFLSLLPSLIWYYHAGQLTTHPAITRNFDLSNWFQPALWLNPRWYFSLFQIEHVWVLTTLGLLFFWLGFWIKVSERKTDLWFVWLISGLLYLTIFNYHAMTHEYYHLFLLPPLAVFVGTGLKKILDAAKPLISNFRLIAISGILLLFLSGLIQPAIKKILSTPKSPETSDEIPASRYRLIEDF